MPSLNELGEFKSSFRNIANERDDVLAKNMPFDDLPLPDTEAVPMDFSAAANYGDASSDGLEAVLPETDSSADDFDFTAFLDSLPPDAAAPPLDDVPADALPDFDIPADDSSAGGLPSIDNLFPSDDFLSGTADDASADEPTEVAAPVEETPGSPDLQEDQLADFGSFEAEGESPESGSDIDSFSAGDLPDFDWGDSGSQDLVTEDSGSQDLQEDQLADFGSFEAESESPESGSDIDSFSSGDLPDFDLGDSGSQELDTEDSSSQDLQEEQLVDFGSFETESDNTEGDNQENGFDMDSFSDSDLPDFDFPESEPLIDSSEDEIEIAADIADTADIAETAEESSGDDFGISDDSIDLGGELPAFNEADEKPFDETFGEPLGEPFDETFDLPSDEGFSIDEPLDEPLPDADFSGMDISSDFEQMQDQSDQLPDADFSGMDTDSESPDMEGGFDLGGEPGMSFEDGSDSSEGMSTEGINAEGMNIADMNIADMNIADMNIADISDLGDDFASDTIDLDSHEDAHEPAPEAHLDLGDDDFALPGLDEIFDKQKTETPQPEQKKGFFRRKKKKIKEELEAEDDIEEIRLSQDDVDRLLKTLSSYPLNLRIVCEELIAEQVILPKQLSKLIYLLINGAHVKETAALAEEITGKPIVIPKSFEKMTGAAFEAEQASFAYIFVHNFLPVLRLFAFIAALAASVIYLGYRFVYIPVKAESIYRRGYERIPAGEYQRANQLFNEAFVTHKKKKWFYLYAESFRDHRRYLLAEEKYDELLRNYPRDKKGVLDYAFLQTYYLLNYDKANTLLQQQLLDYAPNDYDGLLAAGDNFLAWADSDPSRYYDRYEDARFSYARLLELSGWQVPIVERMLKFFIRTDNLKEVLYLRNWFESSSRRALSPASLAELGGYLLDKQLEETRGVPDPYIESIESVRAMLLQAVRENNLLPEPHYHLARYYHSLGNTYEERLTLENAIRAFDLAKTESVRQRLYRVDTHFRYSNLLVNNREFFPAEEQVVRGIQLYEDFVSRNLIRPSVQLGQLYAAKGDLEYFVKSGNMEAALNDYRIAERYGYAPPEIRYRMGAAYYQLEDWGNALTYLFRASSELPLNRRMLYALGNAAYQRGDYFAAQGYYSRLIDILENQRLRLPMLLPNDNPQFLELGERLMMARNNAGVVYEALADQTGNREYRSRAMAFYAESARAWDSITRDPETMVRMRLTDSPGAPGINLGYLNANNALRSRSSYNPQIFTRIDRDVLEPSRWEELQN